MAGALSSLIPTKDGAMLMCFYFARSAIIGGVIVWLIERISSMAVLILEPRCHRCGETGVGGDVV
jgi:hypothetical protein